MTVRLVVCWGLAALACVCAARPGGSKGKERTRAADTLEKRLKLINPVKVGELLLRPTFSCCSVYWGAGAEVPDLALSYRAADGEWRQADRPPYFDESKDHRGSIFGLAEDTSYEVRLASGDKTLATGAFRTWKSDVPVARTVMIDPATATFPICVADRGAPGAFTVRQNDDMDRFAVSPASGTIGPGGRVAFTVVLKPARMNDRRQYRGAFLVRTPDCRQGDMLRHYDLQPGRHVVRLHGVSNRSRKFWLEGLAVTDAPGSFEPR